MHFYIFTGGERNPLYDILFSDLKSLYNVTLISSLPAIPKNKEKLWKLHHSKSMNQIFELPFCAAWNRYSMMEDIISNVDENCCFVFSNVAMEYYEPSLLRIYQKKYGVKMVLYLLDTFDSYWPQKKHHSFHNVEKYQVRDQGEFSSHYLKQYVWRES